MPRPAGGVPAGALPPGRAVLPGLAGVPSHGGAPFRAVGPVRQGPEALGPHGRAGRPSPRGDVPPGGADRPAEQPGGDPAHPPGGQQAQIPRLLGDPRGLRQSGGGLPHRRLPGAFGGDRHRRGAGGHDAAGPAAGPHRPLRPVRRHRGRPPLPAHPPARGDRPSPVAPLGGLAGAGGERKTTSPPAGSPPWTALSTQNCCNTETECSILPHKERRATWHTK